MNIGPGLSYYRARYYDPTAGRLWSEDPVGFDGGADFYVYVDNLPTALLDPYGLSPGWSPIGWWWWFYQNLGPGQLPPQSVGKLSCSTPSECNFTPDMQAGLLCFQRCLGNFKITCGNGQHGPDDPHSKGNGADIGHNENPWIVRGDVERCFTNCFPQGRGGSFGQQELNGEDPSTGYHFHIQFTPGQGVAHGFKRGIQPHGKPKSKTSCPNCKD